MEFKKTNRYSKQHLTIDGTLPRRTPSHAMQSSQGVVPLQQPRTMFPHPPERRVHSDEQEPLSRPAESSRRRIPLRNIRGLIFSKKFIVVAVFIVALVGFFSIKSFINSGREQNDSSNNSVNTSGDVTYQTILPQGKSISDLGGWQRVSPPEGDPVFAYVDSIDGVSVNVSQQPLPKSLKGDVDEWVTELAKKFNATTRIDADDTKVYVGTSAKGPQSAIFTKNGLLILIKSETKVEDKGWAAYARSLN